MKRMQPLYALAVTFLFLGTSTARADLIPWAFDWTATPPAVLGGGGSVSLTNESYHTAVGTSNVVATQLKVNSTANPATPDMFGVLDGAYALTIKIYDLDSGTNGSLTFLGQLQGKFSNSNANITNTFFNPFQQSIVLGGNTYVVTMNSYTPPGPPSQGNLGSIGATVEVRGGPKPNDLPEPSTMLLAGLGMGLAGAGAWRRNRKALAHA